MKTKRPARSKTSANAPTTARPSKPAARPASAKTAPARSTAAKRPTERTPKSDAPKSGAPKSTAAERAAPPSPIAKKKRAANAPSEPAGRSPTVVAQIRELEAELDRLLDHAARPAAPPDPAVDADADLDDAETQVIPREDAASDAPTVADAPPPTVADAPPPPTVADAPPPPTVADAPPPPTDPDPDGVDETRVFASAELFPAAASSVPAPRPSERPAFSSSETESNVFDTARELLSSDFYLRKWGRLAMRGRSEEVDDFGYDPIYDQKARGLIEFLYTRYFRVSTTGLERVPAEGRCLLVANHSGTLPLDGLMIKAAVKFEHASARDVRWLTEDFIHHMPYLGSMMNRLGAVRACQENAERLLEKESLCAVFPEGLKGIGKLFSERYRLQRFGRGGFIKLCLRTNTPIIPVAVVGAEETNPLLFKIEYLSRALGLPYVPVTPTFPVLGPLGLLPAPTKWQIHFGEPLDFGSYGRDAAEDDLLVGKLAERVRATIQGMLDRAIASRKSVFFG